MKYIISLMLCLLFTGCSLKVTVVNGDCNSLNNAEIQYTRRGLLTLMPFIVHTNRKGIAALPADTDNIVVNKEAYKPAQIEIISSDPIQVFLYRESEGYQSGLTDFKGCKE